MPVPVPDRTTERSNWLACPLTVSVVLALAPAPSVAVMVAVPGLLPVATPAALIVATVVLPLVHATAVVCIVTGVEESVVVLFPN